MTRFLQLVISGGVSGSIFAIVALGLVLTFATSGIFNFGHAGIAFATAYLYFELNTGFGWPTWLAALVSVAVVAPLLGFLLDRILFRRLSSAPVYARVVGTIGLSVAMPSLALWIVEQARLRGANIPDNQQVIAAPGLGPVPAEVWKLPGGAVISSDQLIVLAAAALTALGFWVLLRRSRLGLQMRADVDRRDLAELRGVNSSFVSAVAWMLATMSAGLAGVCLGPFLGLSDVSYTFVVLGAIGAVVIARFKSLPIAFAGGIALGIISNLVAGYSDLVLPDFVARLSGLRSAVPFLLTIIALLFWGQSRSRAGGTASTERPPPDPLAGIPAWRRLVPRIVGIGGVLGYVLFLADDFWAGLVARGVILGIVFLSFTVVTGLGGMISLAQAAFVTSGAFTSGWLSTQQGWPFLPALLAGVVVSCGAGALVSWPLRRLGALELALATLALGFVADLTIFQIESIRNGSTGYAVSPPRFSGLDLSNPRMLTIVALVVFGITTLLIRNLAGSATGRAIYAARSSDVAARSVGLSPDRSKVVLFAVSGAVAGLGGALYAVPVQPFTSTTTPPLVGLIWLAVLVTWGVRRPAGALVAGLFFVVAGPTLEVVMPDGGTVGDMVTSGRFLPILFGVGAINLAKEPDGLLALGSSQRRRIVERFRSASDAVDPLPAGDNDTSGGSTSTSGGSRTDVDRAGSVLFARDIRAGYGEVEVLHGVDLDIQPGEIVALLGANGAGKSTLCATLAGLVRPTSGTVLFDGGDLSGSLASARFANGMTLAPERRGIFPGLSVEDNLSVSLSSRGDVRSAMESFPALADRRHQLAGSLSGGEQQLLALAPSLVRSPTLLIADEPTLGLAPLVTAMIFDLLLEFRSNGGSILLVEEKADDVLHLADRVLVMHLGRIVWEGPAADLDRETVAGVYFGSSAQADPTAV